MTQGRVLGLIPAKGGSTRLPRKNILSLGGRPLIAWTVEAARESGVIDRLIVSTEDHEVADIASSLGAEIPFMRPPELARDPAGVVDVALHVLDELERSGDRFESLIILMPTCPFRNADDIRAAYASFRENHWSFLMSVSRFGHTPFAAMGLGENDKLTPYFPNHTGKKSQELPPAYRPNGAIQILDVEAFQREKTYFGEPLFGYEMPIERSIDIDSAEDLRFAEVTISSRGSPEARGGHE
ncbi:MAG: acylneuraminate cytidylyltransferase family protein [Nitrospinota bacterium]|jgi:CMP-N-acetylneuraminic acid synthetase|nr:acylneuraminate cytidylyltransferase family protein [Nitrospinota bacterium]MDP7663037.1 acylneuraminate cytidylyltransferase family protein [Nitrospinota bacterium]